MPLKSRFFGDVAVVPDVPVVPGLPGLASTEVDANELATRETRNCTAPLDGAGGDGLEAGEATGSSRLSLVATGLVATGFDERDRLEIGSGMLLRAHRHAQASGC
jgi:hypothetical protein